MPDEKKPWRITIERGDGRPSFDLSFNTRTNADNEAEAIVRRGYAIQEWNSVDADGWHRTLVPLHCISAIDVFQKR